MSFFGFGDSIEGINKEIEAEKKKIQSQGTMKMKKESLYANIHKKRKEGRPMRKKGEKGAPSPENMASAQAASEDLGSGGGTTTSSIPNPATTAMGPRIKTTTMHDKRRKKDKFPVLLKRFRKYIEDHG